MTLYYEIIEGGAIGRYTESVEMATLLGLTLRTDRTVVRAWDGHDYLEGDEPEKSAEFVEGEIRAERRDAYTRESDPLKLDYDEALARGAENADVLKAAWLAKKDEIRARFMPPQDFS
ncbi:MAG: hypothetical protein LBL52_03035 [Rickettsiales bacterium]|jgi:hypothetical protein|nr:hypothetical protein [Rickettsiales bacterium]